MSWCECEVLKNGVGYHSPTRVNVGWAYCKCFVCNKDIRADDEKLDRILKQSPKWQEHKIRVGMEHAREYNRLKKLEGDK